MKVCVLGCVKHDKQMRDEDVVMKGDVVVLVNVRVGAVLFAIIQLHEWQAYLPRDRRFLQLCRVDLPPCCLSACE